MNNKDFKVGMLVITPHYIGVIVKYSDYYDGDLYFEICWFDDLGKTHEHFKSLKLWKENE